MAENIGHEISSHLSAHALTQKMGPLPVWGWGVLIGGGVVVYMYMHGQSSAVPSAPVDTGVQDSGVPVDPASGLPQVSGDPLGSGGNSDGGGGYSYDPTVPPTDLPSGGYPATYPTVDMPNAHRHALAHIHAARHAKTNKGWAQAIHAALIAHGWRPFIVNHALHNYLTGKPLTAHQHDAINQAHVWALPPHPHAIPKTQVHARTPQGGQQRKPVPHHQQRPRVERRRHHQR